MKGLTIPAGPLSILCLGAHPDDIEIGCAGTILQLLDWRPGSAIRWIVCSGNGARAEEARASAERMTVAAATRLITILDFRDGFLPDRRADLKEFFEGLKDHPAPDLILTHFREDLHQDHRTVAELTWQTFRSHLILEYEVPKYDGDLGRPNAFIPIPPSILERKIAHLLEAFPSQKDKAWFTAETFRGLMRLRGVEAGAPEGYAEAYHLRKAILGPI